MREGFIKSFSRKTKYRKLREDNERLFAENAQIKKEVSLLKKHVDIRFAGFINAFYSLEDIKYKNPDLELLQQINLILLKKFKMLCKEHNIKYWLDSGTLLGAVRHGGFIPWDDDVDIGMTRDDFNKLEEAISKDSELILNYHYVVKSYGQKIGRVFLKDLLRKLDVVFLDIYIFDFLDIDNKKEFQSFFNKTREQFNQEVRELRATHKLDLDHNNFMKLYPKEAKNSDLERLFTKFVSNFKIKNKGNYLKNLTHVCDINLVHSASSVFPLATINFEGEEYTMPNNPDEYLRNQYKNYMAFRADIGHPHHELLLSSYEIMEILRNYIKEHTQNEH